MQVEVRLFGGLTERVGAQRVTLELDEGATVGQLRSALAEAEPSIAPLLSRVNVAVDLEVARDDHELTDSAEIALLPAGGAGDEASPAANRGAGVKTLTGLRAPPLDVAEAVAAVAGPDTGGVAVFLGRVRDHSSQLDEVVRLEYTAYEPMAQKVLAEIAEALVGDHPELRGIALLHAVGDLEVGEDTVLIVCATAHRAAAFAACQEALERVKDQVPVWKREVGSGGTYRWVGLPSPAESAGPRPGAEGG